MVWGLPVLVLVTGVLWASTGLVWGLPVLVTCGLWAAALLVLATGVEAVLDWALLLLVVVTGVVPGGRGGLGVDGRGVGWGFWRFWWWWVRCWGWCRGLRYRLRWHRMMREVL